MEFNSNISLTDRHTRHHYFEFKKETQQKSVDMENFRIELINWIPFSLGKLQSAMNGHHLS